MVSKGDLFLSGAFDRAEGICLGGHKATHV